MKSDTPSLADLEARPAKLESQNRRFKRVGLLFLLVAGSSFLLAQAPRKPPSAAQPPRTREASYDTLVVHRLELRDKAGKLRGLWSAEGEPSALWLYDTAGKTRAALALTAAGPGLTLLDTAGKTRAALALTAAGPGLGLSDAAGKSRAALAVTAAGPGLGLLDTAGFPRVGLAVTADGPVLSFLTAAGKRRAVLREGSLRLEDAQQFRAVVGVTETETTKTGESRTTSAAAVTLFGKDGKVIWRAP